MYLKHQLVDKFEPQLLVWKNHDESQHPHFRWPENTKLWEITKYSQQPSRAGVISTQGGMAETKEACKFYSSVEFDVMGPEEK